MTKIRATFAVVDSIDPARNDPMEVIEEALDFDDLAANGTVELLYAEWEVDRG